MRTSEYENVYLTHEKEVKTGENKSIYRPVETYELEFATDTPTFNVKEVCAYINNDDYTFTYGEIFESYKNLYLQLEHDFVKSFDVFMNTYSTYKYGFGPFVHQYRMWMKNK